jgi:hypothetical protein
MAYLTKSEQIEVVSNEFAGHIHDRMPVFLKLENFAAW